MLEPAGAGWFGVGQLQDLATGGGGYQWATVVPRAWTIYFAEMAGATQRKLVDDFLKEVTPRAGKKTSN